MQLAFDAADRLVELVAERRAPVAAEDAARALYALRNLPAGLARELLDGVVSGDARLAWRGAAVGLAAPPGEELRLESASYAVFDLETTGLRPGADRIVEIGAVRVSKLALEELRLLRELRPPGNVRSARPDRYVYLRRRGAGFVASSTPGPLGPIRSRRLAGLAARALDGHAGDDLAAALPPLRVRLRRLAADLRFEDAARLRDRVAALEEVVGGLAELERLRTLEVCVLVPAAEEGFVRALFVTGGRVAAARTLVSGPGGLVEIEAGLALARRAEPSLAPEDADELLLVGSFLRRPPPELRVVGLDARAILAA